MQYVKHTESTTGAKFPVKQIVKRVTIEGEHTYLLLVKPLELELLPVMNAPHQTQPIVIRLEEVKFCLEYRYMFEYTGLRIVTFGLCEYIVVCKDRDSMDKCRQQIGKQAGNLRNEELEQ